MRGTRAKRLRRESYGDLSLKTPRQYVRVKHQRAATGYIANAPDSPRARYQALKP